ncbi:MAG: DUF4349 domain-containing protein [Chitinophagales bacterium]|nr:DUF4349 domain-containing protein [Chitinophagales bacterium]
MFRKKLVKTSLIILLGFVLLFLFRLLYGYTSKHTDRDEEYFSDFFDGFDQTRKNYASEKYQYKAVEYAPQVSQISNATQPKEFSVSQKYEKTATIKSKTQKFEEDDKKLNGEIKNFNGIIQYEQNSGGKGNRELHLLVGIQPEKFDSFYVAAKAIGNLRSTEITKVDKTSEYKNLNAKKTSLESMRESLIALKSQSGKIDEYINLQNRILDIEEQLQGLGVQLGDFSEENEFCTVRVSLLEGREPVPMSLMHRLKVAFEWTVTYYLQFLLIVALAVFSAFFLLLIIDKLKVLANILKKLNE